jgi:hypothetical protein
VNPAWEVGKAPPSWFDGDDGDLINEWAQRSAVREMSLVESPTERLLHLDGGGTRIETVLETDAHPVRDAIVRALEWWDATRRAATEANRDRQAEASRDLKRFRKD